MLLKAEIDQATSSKFIDNVIGIVFFRTPHRGSDLLPSLERILQSAFSEQSYHRDLRPSSRAAEQLNRLFLRSPVANLLEFLSFYEDPSTTDVEVRSFLLHISPLTPASTLQMVCHSRAARRKGCLFRDQTLGFDRFPLS
jgi:hypothetical protein